MTDQRTPPELTRSDGEICKQRYKRVRYHYLSAPEAISDPYIVMVRQPGSPKRARTSEPS